MAIRRLTISGFRGVLAPLELEFVKGGSVRSMVVYGRNGTGKSSITDAWEWLHGETIGHLGREGAGAAAYPHRSAAHGQSFVEVEFDDPQVGTVRLSYDHTRITRPIATGNLDAFRRRTPHPCHVRFADLTRFVYLTKAERYDLLAQLMGFEPQVAYQKALRRVQKELRRKLNAEGSKLKEVSVGLKGVLNLAELSTETVTTAILDALARHKIAADHNWGTIKAGVAELRGRVEEDPNAARLADLRDVGGRLKVVRLSGDLFPVLDRYLQLVRPFKDEDDSLKRLLLLGLYEKGAEVVARDGDDQACPLCGTAFEGSIREHIAAELAKLRELKVAYDDLERARERAWQLVGAAIPAWESLVEGSGKLKDETVHPALAGLLSRLADLALACENLANQLGLRSELLDQAGILAIRSHIEALRDLAVVFAAERTAVLDTLAARVRELQANSARAQLVEDYQRVYRATVEWEAFLIQLKRYRALLRVDRNLGIVVERYVEESLKDVGSRFDAISSNVAKYFETLEQQTTGIGQPVLKILRDPDRSVILEVHFHGQATSPAYKYLSESQLNSFGLAVFLASAQHFNPDFKFLVLDDVVNSLDGYKRPQLIAVLKRYFSDYQVVLLTHDSVWRDRMYRELPTWRRVHFRRFDFGVGPVHGEGTHSLDDVQQYILDDKARTAGQVLGPYMEEVLQDVCESFEIEVKYNRRNEYTLDPLLDRLRVRLQSKLAATHPLVALLSDLRAEMGFRNLCAHYKDPEIDLTPEEMQVVLDKWWEIEKQLRCQVDACREILRWTEPTFSCACGASALVKNMA